MPSCLGLYIEDNLIKYAKISKNNQALRVESFGVKFYETLSTAIKQIVEETYSFKVPIAINTNDEWYNDIQVFSLLAKNDMENAIKTEFENICYEKDINKNIYEQRHVFANSYKGDDKIGVIHIAVPKTILEQRKNQFSEYRVSTITPVSMAITNLVTREKKGTSLVVNIEKETTITKITNGVTSSVQVINVGAGEILDKISKKENSYSKAYDICKASTIYTEADKDLQYEENEYLEDIMPTLFKIVSKVRETVEQSLENIEKVYITGTGSVINNIDIYFQDSLRNIRCEILKPNFISNNSKINIKDYIEVNSAIAIALQGLEKNNKSLNFKIESGMDKFVSILNSNASDIGQLKLTKSMGNVLGRFNRQLDFLSTTFILLTVLYFTGAIIINTSYENKIKEVDLSIDNTNQKIVEIQKTEAKFESQEQRYQTLIKNIEDLTDANSEDKRYRNTIPNLLNNIMAVIPKNVQLNSIENTSGTHIVITAKSNIYQQIAYFKTKLDTEGILKNVVSDTGTSKDGYLTVTIEGELP